MARTPAGAAVLPRVVVAGLGPAGPELIPAGTLQAVAGAARVFVRTQRHPAVLALLDASPVPVYSFDHHYERAERFEDVYGAIVEDLVAAALAAPAGAAVVYAVPGSPFVAERSVELLRADGRVAVDVVHAPSFLDLAWDRLGVDPLAAGVRLVDGTDFAVAAAGERGPLLVAQVHDRSVLSAVKLAAEEVDGAVLLHHLGLDDEQVVPVAWSELDRTLEPDHLTSVWIPTLAAPVAAEVMRLAELVRTLRARCPWDREQTHGSLGRHLLEESYETLDAIEAFAAAEPDVPASLVAHLEEELGDLLFQVLFHATLAEEEGRFTLADVARGTHDKLVARHPHVFGDAVAETPDEVAARWEVLKKAEKGRTSVTEGIPAALPSLALAAKLQRKAESVGMALPSLAERLAELAAGVEGLQGWPAAAASGEGSASGETLQASAGLADELGRLLFVLADAARRLGVDPETALRARTTLFRRQVEASE
ncbi:MAG TPA: MazG family protein [Acidimicrobiales bacterium]|nr:MazG family protein [Acidimicrobiales bacterium]